MGCRRCRYEPPRPITPGGRAEEIEGPRSIVQVVQYRPGDGAPSRQTMPVRGLCAKRDEDVSINKARTPSGRMPTLSACEERNARQTSRRPRISDSQPHSRCASMRPRSRCAAGRGLSLDDQAVDTFSRCNRNGSALWPEQELRGRRVDRADPAKGRPRKSLPRSWRRVWSLDRRTI